MKAKIRLPVIWSKHPFWLLLNEIRWSDQRWVHMYNETTKLLCFLWMIAIIRNTTQTYNAFEKYFACQLGEEKAYGAPKQCPALSERAWELGQCEFFSAAMSIRLPQAPDSSLERLGGSVFLCVAERSSQYLNFWIGSEDDQRQAGRRCQMTSARHIRILYQAVMASSWEHGIYDARYLLSSPSRSYPDQYLSSVLLHLVRAWVVGNNQRFVTVLLMYIL